ncbi:glycosyltransferase family 9 protein [Candidatus Binatia bacterium]|nr:glycosyltransferase family 9 protein [Candidatus Binatia bacterium]
MLIYRCGTLGDTLVALPAINAVRQRFSDARYIHMTASDASGKLWADEVLREFGWFDAFVTYRPADLADPREIVAVAARVRAQRPDLVVHLGSDKNSVLRAYRDRLFFLLAGVGRFVSCPSDKVGHFGGLKRTARVYPQEVVRLLDSVRAAGVGEGQVRFDVPIRERHEQRVDEVMAAGGLEGERPLVAVCPGSKQAIKCWPVERYGTVGERLISDAGVNLVVVGGADEAAAGCVVGARWPRGRWLNAAGCLSVLESAALLRRCAFYVGNDTGAMHLMAAVGGACVAVFSAREPAYSWFPWGSQHIVLRRDVPCRHCYLDVCIRERTRCLTEIGVDDVWDACSRMLSRQ